MNIKPLGDRVVVKVVEEEEVTSSSLKPPKTAKLREDEEVES